MLSTNRKWLFGLSAFAAIAASCVLFIYDPSSTPLYPRCVFHSLTGWQCPGCGTTRALHAVLHGNVLEALRYNAMLFAFAPFLILATARPRWFQRAWIGWAAAALLIAWGVGRNLW
jgi:uncharacterized protein DUF2752